MARILYNNQSGYLAAPLNATDVTSTIEFGSSFLPNFATLSPPDYIPLVLDAGTPNMEIVWLTAFTSGGSSGTITRAAEDSLMWPETVHGYMPPSVKNNTWACAPTQRDFPALAFSGYSGSAISCANGAATNITFGTLVTTVQGYSSGPLDDGAIVEFGNIYFETPGYYLVNACVLVANNATAAYNGSRFFVQITEGSGAAELLRGQDYAMESNDSGDNSWTVAGVVRITAGALAQYINIRLFNGYSTAVDTYGGSVVTCQVTMLGAYN